MNDLHEGILSEFAERQRMPELVHKLPPRFCTSARYFTTAPIAKLDRARYTARRKAAGKCLRCANPSTSARCAMCNQLRREKRRAAKALKK